MSSIRPSANNGSRFTPWTMAIGTAIQAGAPAATYSRQQTTPAHGPASAVRAFCLPPKGGVSIQISVSEWWTKHADGLRSSARAVARCPVSWAIREVTQVRKPIRAAVRGTPGTPVATAAAAPAPPKRTAMASAGFKAALVTSSREARNDAGRLPGIPARLFTCRPCRSRAEPASGQSGSRPAPPRPS